MSRPKPHEKPSDWGDHQGQGGINPNDIHDNDHDDEDGEDDDDKDLLVLNDSSFSIFKSVLSNPLCVVRDRLQVQSALTQNSLLTKYKNGREAFASIKQNEGLLRFSRGWSLNLINFEVRRVIHSLFPQIDVNIVSINSERQENGPPSWDKTNQLSIQISNPNNLNTKTTSFFQISQRFNFSASLLAVGMVYPLEVIRSVMAISRNDKIRFPFSLKETLRSIKEQRANQMAFGLGGAAGPGGPGGPGVPGGIKKPKRFFPFRGFIPYALSDISISYSIFKAFNGPSIEVSATSFFDSPPNMSENGDNKKENVDDSIKIGVSIVDQLGSLSRFLFPLATLLVAYPLDTISKVMRVHHLPIYSPNQLASFQLNNNNYNSNINPVNMNNSLNPLPRYLHHHKSNVNLSNSFSPSGPTPSIPAYSYSYSNPTGSILGTARMIYENGGLAGFYRGFFVHSLHLLTVLGAFYASTKLSDALDKLLEDEMDD